MRDTLNATQISTMEELEPEPQKRGRWVQARELALGLLLLGAITLWAGGTWWHQSSQEAAYHAGQQAEAQKGWEAARDDYIAASGYRDADARAAQARSKIAERDSQYAAAQQALAGQNWLPALQAIQAVQIIEPDYKDIAGIYSVASQQVYSESVRGAIARRNGDGDPALYYRAASGWLELEKSDVRSALVGDGPAGYAIYDVPTDQKLIPTPTYPFNEQTLPSRSLIAVSFAGDHLQFWPLSLPLAFDGDYRWGRAGAWLLTPISNSTTQKAQPGVRESISGMQLTYEAYGSAVTSSVKLPSSAWAIMDLSPDGRHILLADLSQYADTAPQAGLYLADSDGSNLRLLTTQAGGFQRAVFSPDGSHALLVTYRPVRPVGTDFYTEQETAFLVDLNGGPTTVLDEISTLIDHPNNLPSIEASFTSQGTYAGDVLLAKTDGGTTTFSVLDPAHLGAPLLTCWFQGSQLPSGPVWTGDTDKKGAIAAMWEGQDGRLQVARIEQDGSQMQHLPERGLVAGPVYATGAEVQGQGLLYSVAQNHNDISLYYTPLSTAIGGGIGTSKLLITERNGAAMHHEVWPFYAGSGLFAYVQDRDLHVSAYDGKTGIVVEKNFGTFMNDGFGANP